MTCLSKHIKQNIINNKSNKKVIEVDLPNGQKNGLF